MKKWVSVILCVMIVGAHIRCDGAVGVSAYSAILVEKNSARVIYERTGI